MPAGEARERYGDNLPREVSPMERRRRLWVRTEGLFTVDDETGQWGGGVEPMVVNANRGDEGLIVAGESYLFDPIVVWKGIEREQVFYAIGEAMRSVSSMGGFRDIHWFHVFPTVNTDLFVPAPQDYLAFELLNSTRFSSGLTAMVAERFGPRLPGRH